MVVDGMEADFHEAVKAYGKETAKDLWMNTIQARQLAISLIKEHHIACDLEQPGSLYVGGGEEDGEKLRREAAERISCGIECEILEKGEWLRHSPFTTALFNPSDALLHPVRFIRGLAEVAETQGVTIYERTPAIEFDAHTVATPEGMIKAKKVVIAMESANPYIPEDAHITRSQAIVTEPLSHSKFLEMDWGIGGMLWPTDGDYISLRKIGNRLFACKDLSIDPTEEELAKNKRWQIDKIRSFFPMLTEEDLQVSHQWTGLMVSTPNQRPCIRDTNGCIEVFGHSGNGLTNGIFTGKLVAECCGGAEIPKIYQP
jgi:glycine/D-amino acid oxidase-like deaminating enzyme